MVSAKMDVKTTAEAHLPAFHPQTAFARNLPGACYLRLCQAMATRRRLRRHRAVTPTDSNFARST